MPDNINRRVAEKVMGFDLNGPFIMPAFKGAKVNARFPFKNKNKEGCNSIPNYTSDPTAIFGPGGVVDVMLGKGFNFTLTRRSDGATHTSFQGAKTTQFAASCSANQLMAICLAALEAVEGETMPNHIHFVDSYPCSSRFSNWTQMKELLRLKMKEKENNHA